LAEAPGSRTQPPRVSRERPILKTGRTTGPHSLPYGLEISEFRFQISDWISEFGHSEFRVQSSDWIVDSGRRLMEIADLRSINLKPI
jgi:hypothetical protein